MDENDRNQDPGARTQEVPPDTPNPDSGLRTEALPNPEPRNGGPDSQALAPDTWHLAPGSLLDHVRDLVVKSVDSQNSQAAYGRALDDFIRWYEWCIVSSRELEYSSRCRYSSLNRSDFRFRRSPSLH